MKKKHLLFSLLITAGIIAFTFNSCDKDDDPVAFTLESLMAGTIDLNGATSASGVPVDFTVTATFSTDIDPETAIADGAITLVQDYDDADISLNILASGKTITITSSEELATGTLHELSFGAGITSADGEAITAFTRTFTTEGTFAPAGVVAHWTFEDSPDDVVGSYAASGEVAITYTDSRNTDAGKAATFDGDASIIEIPNGDVLMNTADFTLSFWVKTNSSGHVDGGGNPTGHFVMGLGAFKGFQFEIPGDYSSCKLAASYEVAGGNTEAQDLWFNGEALTVDSWQGWTFSKDLTGSGGVAALLQDTWAHIVCMYESSTKLGTMYINGEKMKQQDFNLYGAEHPLINTVGMKYGGVSPEVENELAFGFIQSRAGTLWDAEPWGGYDFTTANHFKGQLDDVRIFHKALTETEIQLMYNSEKP